MQCLILKVNDLSFIEKRGFAKAKPEAEPFFAVGCSTSLNQHIIINVSRANNESQTIPSFYASEI